MATATELLSAVLLLSIFLKVNGKSCELSSIKVGITNTGLKVGHDPVFEVEVKNMCRCTLINVFLRSEGFASSVPVDPNLFRRMGGNYLVNDGKGIPSSLSVKFRYSWDRAFKMAPASLLVAC